MIVFRLCKSKYAYDLTGAGAEKSGGRWNSRGTRMIYTSGSRALCTTEIAVHTPLGNIPNDYSLITIQFPDELLLLELKVSQLPKNWKTFPHSHSTQMVGDKFISEAKYFVMKVPSAVVQGEHNFLINPYHHQIQKLKIIKVEKFLFDKRLFNR